MILVPLMADVDLTLRGRPCRALARAARAEVRLVYLLEVTRTLPLNAPLLEQEQAAQEALAKAVQLRGSRTFAPQEHVERVRDAVDGALAAIDRTAPRRSSSARPSTRWITATTTASIRSSTPCCTARPAK